MARWRPTKCKQCGTTADAGATISARGLCEACGHANMAEAARAMASKTGTRYQKWADGMERAAANARRRTA